jgi:single-strand DNA-binding protein
MASFNSVVVMGNLTDNVDKRICRNNLTVSSFTLAINEKINGNSVVTYLPVKAYGKVAENCAKYLWKGSNILLNGKLRMETWQDKNTAQNRSKLYLMADSMQFIGEKQNNNSNSNNYTPDKSSYFPADTPPRGYEDDPENLDDDIAF